ncbi:MAG: hypothetical protein JRG80_22750 [Deltaproteobacteria bacterium]|nr:hypothetical protein [Deltaproteobacteria bacterium]MBW2402032.1 hypothetical protein [Deltaproteobacteria bacterium]
MSSGGFAMGAVEGGKREQNTSRNRSAILRAAREASCEIGFGATTVRDIIRRTDLATGVRTRADVDAATEFATDLFLGGIERMSRKF